MCVGCDYITRHAGAGRQHQECNYPIKSHTLITTPYSHIFFMYEDDCPLLKNLKMVGEVDMP